MNETIRQLFDRRSVRAFEEREIGTEEKETILQAAFMAPTAGDMQMYTVIDITDQTIKEKLAKLCDHQPFIAKGKMVLIFCADLQKWVDAFCLAGLGPASPGAGFFMLGADDALIAAQNAVTAAESMGIGSCYIGDVMENREQMTELLNLPRYVYPAAMLVFGYPTEQQKTRSKPPRADRGQLVHTNGYRRMEKEELMKLMSVYAKEKETEEWLSAFFHRKYDSDFVREMNRSVEEYFNAF